MTLPHLRSLPSWVRWQTAAAQILEPSNHKNNAAAADDDDDCNNKFLEEQLWTACLGDALEGHYRVLLEHLALEGLSSKKLHAAVLWAFCDETNNSMALQTHSTVREQLSNTTLPEKQPTTVPTVRIQWQVRLRLALWQCLGSSAFTTAWSAHILRDLTPKQRRRIKREGMTAWQLCRHDLTSLISLGVLHTGTSAADFLSLCGLPWVEIKTLSKTKPCWKVQLTRQVWSFFDLVPGDDTIPPMRRPASVSAVLPPLAEEASVQSHSTQGSTLSVTRASKENANTAYFGKRIRLTAPATQKVNALLGKSARTRFVGSHFNTQLSNMSALFQSVPAAPVGMKATTSKAAATGTKAAPPKQPRKRVAVCETPAPRRKSRVVWETPNDLHRPRVWRL